MPAVARGRGVVNQYVTSDLDDSRVILLPNKNRHRFFLAAHPDNTDGVWVHLIPGADAPQGGGKLITGAAPGVILAPDDASANVDIDATNANSGIYIAEGTSFGEDGSMQFIFDGGITAIGNAAGQKLVVLEY